MVQSCEAIIIGAGPAGLATAAAFRSRGLSAAILEKSDAVGAVWRRHYDRLHLHTDRARSDLPGLAMPKAYDRYPSRAQVVEYLEAYTAKFNLKPVFNAPVGTVRREGRGWRAEAGENSRSAPIVVIATGWADYPHTPTWPDMETFVGAVLHSSGYRNPGPFAGKRSSAAERRRSPAFSSAAPFPRRLDNFVRSASRRNASPTRRSRCAPLERSLSRPDELIDPGGNRLARQPQSLLVEQVRVVGRLKVDLAGA